MVAELLDLFADRPTYWRTLTHAVLQAPEAVVPGTASTTELFAGLWRGQDPDRAAASAVAGVTALGWLVFGGFMAETTGGDPADIRRLVEERVAAAFATEGPAPSASV